jgi:titin
MSLFRNLRNLSRWRTCAARRTCTYRPVLESLEDRLVPASVLNAPTISSIAAVSFASAKITWTPVANEAGYRILLWNGTQGVAIATVGPHTTTAVVGHLPAGQQVWLGVEAFNAKVQADSAWSSVTLPTLALTPATGLKATAVSSSEVNLSWTPATGQTGYHVLEWNGTKAVVIATLGAGVHRSAITQLAAGTAYFFSIEAFNQTGSSATTWASATTLGQPITAPTHLTGTATDTQITLTWSPAQGATGYNIFEWQSGKAVQVGQTDAKTTMLAVANLQPGTLYWFYVQSYNPTNSAITAWKSFATTAVSNPLQAPGNVTTSEPTPGSIQINWTASVGAAGYWIFQWTGSSWVVVANPAATDTSATITGLPAGTKQYFLVMAYTADVVQHASSPILSVIV